MPTQITFNQLMIIGAIVGFILGLVPLILGFTKGNLKTGLIGFFVSIVAGTFFSFLGALPASAVFSWLVLRKKSALAAADGAHVNSAEQHQSSDQQ